MVTSKCTGYNSLLTILTIIPLIFPRLALAQDGDGGAASGNVPGAYSNGQPAGSQGTSTSSANLSTGAIVAVAVIVVIVVIGGVLTAVLFWQAKKRQWTVKETLRHSKKRVASGLKAIASPLTPHRSTFSPLKTRFDPSETRALRGPSPQPYNFSRKNRGDDVEEMTLKNTRTNALDRGRDLEKGEKVAVASNEARSQSRKPKMSIDIPGKKKPEAVEPPQTPMWTKIIGRS